MQKAQSKRLDKCSHKEKGLQFVSIRINGSFNTNILRRIVPKPGVDYTENYGPDQK